MKFSQIMKGFVQKCNDDSIFHKNNIVFIVVFVFFCFIIIQAVLDAF